MQAGISTASLFCKKYNEEAVSLLNEWGVRQAEVFYTSYCEYKPEFSRKMLPLKGNINVHSVHVLNTQFEPQLYGAHPRAKADAFAILEDVMKSAQILGATHYSFHGIARLKRTFREDLERVGNLTHEIAQFCEKFGVKLCYENVEWAFYNRPGVYAQLKERAPTIMGVLDIKQARISGYDYSEYLTEMGQDISHVHVSDIDTDGKMCLPGRGVFDFETLVKRLRDVGFDGPLLIENYQKDYEEIEELRASYEYLCELIDKFL